MCRNTAADCKTKKEKKNQVNNEVTDMIFTRIFRDMYENVERRCAENNNDFKTTLRYYLALTNIFKA